MELILVSGMSGAGKTKAVNILEDVGFYCVDNMPPKIIPLLAALCSDTANAEIQQVAMVVDVRSREMFAGLGQALTELQQNRFPYKILFLDASTDILLQRFKETRRRHPLMDEATAPTLGQAIETERKLLHSLRESADYVIDTSKTTPAQLRERIVRLISAEDFRNVMPVQFLSFGYKYGLPLEADLVFDVRCLPNPFYIPSLREHTGKEACVRDYVMQFPQTTTMLQKLEDLLTFLLPLYLQEGKSQLVVAIGCTGGKHRSVAVAEHLASFLSQKNRTAFATHRDCDK